jgi:hypothetical protein
MKKEIIYRYRSGEEQNVYYSPAFLKLNLALEWYNKKGKWLEDTFNRKLTLTQREQRKQRK